MDAKLAHTVYRLLDLLEACEDHIKQGDLSMEAILCLNQARLAVSNLEYSTGADLKAFLKQTIAKSVAKNDKLQ